jgi:hypothetical protein
MKIRFRYVFGRNEEKNKILNKNGPFSDRESNCITPIKYVRSVIAMLTHPNICGKYKSRRGFVDRDARQTQFKTNNSVTFK